MKEVILSVFDGYGSFFALTNPLSKLLILICAMAQPASGLTGLLGGLCVIIWLRILKLRSDCERIEIVNGILFGMLLGSLYAPDPRLFGFLVLGGLLIALFSSVISETLTKNFRLPLLGLPYAAVSFVLLPVLALQGLKAAHPAILYAIPLPPVVNEILAPLGAIYFNGTPIGGLLVALGFLMSSPYLALIAVAASAICCGFLHLLGIPLETTNTLVAEMNAILTAAVIGGLFATPGRKSVAVALVASLVSCLFALAAARMLWVFNLPMLAVPFVATTYICLIGLSRKHGGDWTHFWLVTPGLPERTIEQLEVAHARGVDPRSVALKLPVAGAWSVYQGRNGKHTHIGAWQYAIDLFQLDQSGQSFSNLGRDLADYHCFKQAVLSPAYGTVAGIRSDLPDNRPGEVDVANNWGNFVLLRLDNGMYCLMAHLQQDSVVVAVGARVAPGQLLANCGNSGRSPQPHLHIQVQEGPALDSRTVPFHFVGVLEGVGSTTQFQLNCCPAEGATLQPAAPNATLKAALKLNVGMQFLFEVEAPNTMPRNLHLQVELDLNGQFWIRSDSGARAAFVVGDDLIAFFNRSGPADTAFDAYLLAMSLTPLSTEAARWIDATPLRLMPLSPLQRAAMSITRLWRPCTTSTYRRHWEPLMASWTQIAIHGAGKAICQAEATISDTHGIASFRLSDRRGSLISARLIGFGLKQDNGIPERRDPVALVTVT